MSSNSHCDDTKKFVYDIGDVLDKPVSRHEDTDASRQEREFDSMLKSKWEQAAASGCFRYTIDDELPWKYIYNQQHDARFFVQLNLKRGVDRRKPQQFFTVKQAFDASAFNFSKIKASEILLHLTRVDGSERADVGVIAVNVSPIVKYHSLFIPSLSSTSVQKITYESILTCLELMYVSGGSDLLIGFNSLCSGASVNHLHFHLYYLPQTLDVSRTPLTHIAANLYEARDYVSGGFVIVSEQKSDISPCARQILAATDSLYHSERAHNVCLIRGLDDTNRDGVVRVFIWPRRPVTGAKVQCPRDAFVVALCELAGHLPIENEGVYEGLSGEGVVSTIQGVSS